MTRKILCATDGTEHSKVAVVLAAELASKFGSELTICTVNVAHGGARGVLISRLMAPGFEQYIRVTVGLPEDTDAVLDGPASLVLEQAENRLHAQTAVLESIFA